MTLKILRVPFFLLILCAAGAAYAQAAQGPGASTDDLTQGFLALANWRTLSVLALFSTIVNILVNLYKRYGTYVPLAWRPVIALALGILGSVTAALVTGAPLANAIVLGVPAGFAAGGGAIALHEAWNTIRALFTPKKDGTLTRIPTTTTKAVVGSLLGFVCMTQTGCVTGLSAAYQASPACYGLATTSNLSTAEAEIKAIVSDVTSANPIGATEQVISNYGLDKQAALCLYQAVANEIKYPNGGEAAYVPDAGSPADAGPAVAMSALEKAVAMTPQQTTALERIQILQQRAQTK